MCQLDYACAHTIVLVSDMLALLSRLQAVHGPGEDCG